VPCLLNQAGLRGNIIYFTPLEILFYTSAETNAFLLSFLELRHSSCKARRPLRDDSSLVNHDFSDLMVIVKPDDEVPPVEPEFRAAASDVTCSYPDLFLARP
jgi:hypothetical protein